MGDFFHGWRRKIGVATLLMALVFMAVSARSRTHADWILLFGKTVVVSGDQRFFVLKRSNIDRILMTSTTRGPETINGAVTLTKRKDVISLNFQYIFLDRFGWGYEAMNEVMNDFAINTNGPKMKPDGLPHWSIALPLTLLSAYLLLSKPRKSTPMKITDPTAEKVV